MYNLHNDIYIYIYSFEHFSVNIYIYIFTYYIAFMHDIYKLTYIYSTYIYIYIPILISYTFDIYFMSIPYKIRLVDVINGASSPHMGLR